MDMRRLVGQNIRRIRQKKGQPLRHASARYQSKTVLPSWLPWASLLPRDPLLHDSFCLYLQCRPAYSGRNQTDQPTETVASALLGQQQATPCLARRFPSHPRAWVTLLPPSCTRRPSALETSAVKRGVNLLKIFDQTGHKSLEMPRVY